MNGKIRETYGTNVGNDKVWFDSPCQCPDLTTGLSRFDNRNIGGWWYP